jgi:two-component system response regulator YesN
MRVDFVISTVQDRMRILIVDDEYLVRLRLRTTIDWHRYGFELVGEAEDGETGLDLAVKLRPDIIVTDMSMPFLDGIEFMEQLRNRGIGAKIIVLSGYDDFQYAKGAITYGASDYIVKPVENEVIISSIRKLAGAIRKERVFEQIGKQKLIMDLITQLKHLRSRKTAGSAKLVEAAVKYIRQHYADDSLTVNRIAEELYISPSHLMHVFKENTSSTVNDYMTECRIEKAKELLSANKYKIYEICDRVGIRNSRYFSQLFKRYTNQTPSEYVKSRFYE